MAYRRLLTSKSQEAKKKKQGQRLVTQYQLVSQFRYIDYK
jgi:hypothetical protein